MRESGYNNSTQQGRKKISYSKETYTDEDVFFDNNDDWELVDDDLDEDYEALAIIETSDEIELEDEY